METKTYPKGTTKEQWDQYNAELAEHTKAMYLKRIHFDQAIFCIQGVVSADQLSLIKARLSSEIAMASSCDAPNVPGYNIANND